MSRLSLSLDKMRKRYDAVVVGSGYGGGIAASRLARAGRRVCVLERGKELRPGEYPNTLGGFVHELQVDFPKKRLGSLARPRPAVGRGDHGWTIDYGFASS